MSGVEVKTIGPKDYPLTPEPQYDVIIYDRFLPQAYPEGCPTHPSYPAGHAVIAGACVTVIKACLDESYVLPEPVMASADGLSLLPWKGADLTVGGELDKLAANIIQGRNHAGLHWRSDAVEGPALRRLLAALTLDAVAELALLVVRLGRARRVSRQAPGRDEHRQTDSGSPTHSILLVRASQPRITVAFAVKSLPGTQPLPRREFHTDENDALAS